MTAQWIGRRVRPGRGTLGSISHGERIFHVIAEENGDSRTFALGARTKLKANKKVLHKENLAWADLITGLFVEVKFIAGVREALEIRVIAVSPRPD